MLSRHPGGNPRCRRVICTWAASATNVTSIPENQDDDDDQQNQSAAAADVVKVGEMRDEEVHGVVGERVGGAEGRPTGEPDWRATV